MPGRDGGQHIADVQPRDRAGRAPDVLTQARREGNHRSVKAVAEARGQDPDHPRMPVLPIDTQRCRVVEHRGGKRAQVL